MYILRPCQYPRHNNFYNMIYWKVSGRGLTEVLSLHFSGMAVENYTNFSGLPVSQSRFEPGLPEYSALVGLYSNTDMHCQCWM
jgi:hypothetical protein